LRDIAPIPSLCRLRRRLGGHLCPLRRWTPGFPPILRPLGVRVNLSANVPSGSEPSFSGC